MSATDKFIDGIERLLNSNVITAGKDIRAFLIELSNDKKLRSVLTSAGEGFHYNEEFRRVFEENNPLPSQDTKVVALIAGLLFSIDVGKTSLGNLLFRLYPNHDGASGYSKFLVDFIQPFAESFVKLLVGEPLEEVRVAKVSVYDKMNIDVKAIINDLIAAVQAAEIDDENVDEIVDLSNGLVYVLSFNDALLTRNAYYGLYNTIRFYGIDVPQINELQAILKLYGVL